jgi:hypothetical protein
MARLSTVCSRIVEPDDSRLTGHYCRWWRILSPPGGRLSLEMATKRDCEAALRGLAKRLDGVEDSVKMRSAPDRTVSCRIPDLETTWFGRLHDGALCDITNRPVEDAQIRLTVSSDDLLAVTAGELPFASAWAAGRLKIEASVLDMIRLRSLI